MAAARALRAESRSGGAGRAARARYARGVLTLRKKPHVRRQTIADQVARSPQTGMRVVTVKPGEGVSE